MANKELFNQPLKTLLSDNDRLAVGIPGLSGANNIEFYTFKRNYLITDCIRKTNTNSENIILPANSKLISIDIKIISGITTNIQITCNNPDIAIFDVSGTTGDIFINNYGNFLKIDTTFAFEATGGNFDLVISYIKNYF